MRNIHSEVSLKIKKVTLLANPSGHNFLLSHFQPRREVLGGFPADWSPVCSCSGGSVGPSPDPGQLQPAVGLGQGLVSPAHPAAALGPLPGHHGALARDRHGLWHTGTPGLWQRGRVDAQTCLQLHSKVCPSHRWGQRNEALVQVSPSPPLRWWLMGCSPMAGSCPALPDHVCMSMIAEGLSDALPAASRELFSQWRQCRLAHVYHYGSSCAAWTVPAARSAVVTGDGKGRAGPAAL